MKLSRLPLLILPLFLMACAASPQQQADYTAVERSGASSAIYDKMVHGDDLSLHDIEALSRHHVNSGIILRYIRDHGTVYYIGATDVTDLQQAGVDRSVIDYMLQTARGGYWGPGAYPYYGGYDPFWYGPAFYGGFYFHGGGYYRGGGGYHGGGGWHH